MNTSHICDTMLILSNIDANVIHFQCPSCGFELQQTIGLLKAGEADRLRRLQGQH